jgi:hypothetical protein
MKSGRLMARYVEIPRDIGVWNENSIEIIDMYIICEANWVPHNWTGHRLVMLYKNPLPTVEGIGPSRLRVPAGPWKNILEYLQERFPKVKPETWISRMEKEKVVDEHGIPLSAETPCRRGTLFFTIATWTWNHDPFCGKFLFGMIISLLRFCPIFCPLFSSAGFFVKPPRALRIRTS